MSAFDMHIHFRRNNIILGRLLLNIQRPGRCVSACPPRYLKFMAQLFKASLR